MSKSPNVKGKSKPGDGLPPVIDSSNLKSSRNVDHTLDIEAVREDALREVRTRRFSSLLQFFSATRRQLSRAIRIPSMFSRFTQVKRLLRGAEAMTRVPKLIQDYTERRRTVRTLLPFFCHSPA